MQRFLFSLKLENPTSLNIWKIAKKCFVSKKIAFFQNFSYLFFYKPFFSAVGERNVSHGFQKKFWSIFSLAFHLFFFVKFWRRACLKTLDPKDFYAIPIQNLVFLISFYPEFLEKKNKEITKKLLFVQFLLFLFCLPC